MSKKFAKRNLICFAVLAVLLIALCFINIAIPATTSRFVGFAPAITTDIDIAGGLASKYEIIYDDKAIDEDAELDKTVNMLSSKLASYGYGNTCVSVGTNDNIYIEIPKIREAEGVLMAIATTGALCITTASSAADATAENSISGEEVVDAYAQFSQTSNTGYSWGVNVKLTDAGKSKLATMTEDAASSQITLNIFVGENTISQIGIGGQVNTNDLYFYGTSSTQDAANVTALGILMGKYYADFDMVNDETIEIAPLISPAIQILIYVAIAIIAVALLAMFFIMFGELGWIVSLCFAFFMTLTVFFMQAIPIFVLSFSGVIGLVIGMVLFFISNLIIFKAAKDGYAEGKKIPLAVKLGINNSVMKIVDISVVAIIFAVGAFIIGGVYAQSFAMAIGICAALNLLTSLAFNKLFTKWYTRINTKDAKKLHFTREEHVNELD